jgi:uncharacterized membrane protein
MGKAKKDYSKRIHFMDTARGIIIIGVVVYHTLFDLYAMYGIGVDDFLFHPIVNYVRDFGAGLLILISGISCHLSRSNLKRGILCLAVALGFSIFTYLLMPENFIFFGILHLMSFCMLAYGLGRKAIDKIPGYIAPIVFVIFLFLFGLPNGYLGFFGKHIIDLPKAEGNVFLYCLGLPWRSKLLSADYFPVLPWFLLFLCGTITGKYFKEGRIPKFFYKDICPPITFIGTKTIYIYVLHQPLVFGILYLIFIVFNK